ncbi:RibD family protein [Acuticoccus kandeliae]|uniref:RibD family protein n=1 Tax=Acuticoccus kandeliae TaxID=2073160 RepID=UPI000D3E0F05|nr:dihydrofolate reductase family protein [Acuticoccus kandeliae]
MRPKITCHMVTSLDGRLDPHRWSYAPGDGLDRLMRIYDETASRLDAEGWIVGRKTMGDFVDELPPVLLDAPRPRTAIIAERGARGLAVALDPSGRLDFTSGDLDGDHVVAVVGERVADARLDALRAAGVSVVFAGPDGHDLAAALDTIGTAFGVSHLLLEGGATVNGAFLAAGLLDATSTLIWPALDGLTGVPAIYEHSAPAGSRPAAGRHLALTASEVLEGGVVWLRHDMVAD